jgi:hypothetical protein
LVRVIKRDCSDVGIWHLKAFTLVILWSKGCNIKIVSSKNAYIYKDNIRKECLSIHDQSVSRKWLGKDAPTDDYFVSGEGLRAVNR